MFVNKQDNQVMVNVIHQVNVSDIREEKLDGIDYIVINSKTMPDDIVMNGIMYPADEIDSTIQTINETPAPMGHPKIDGVYVSAFNQRAQNKFNQLGAINKYIGKEGGSHVVEKWIVKGRMETTDHGKVLNEAIANGNPIHSSTGVLIQRVENSGENEHGTYNHVAKISHFDHDAILVNETGAATPEQGVGLMVNSKEEIPFMFVNLSSGLDMSDSANKLRERLSNEIQSTFGNDITTTYLNDYNANTVIYEKYTNGVCTTFASKYSIAENGGITLSQPTEVDKSDNYEAVQPGLFANIKQMINGILTPNSEQETDPMKEKMIAALNAASVKTDGLDDDQLFSAYNELMAKNHEQSETKDALTKEDVAEIAANAASAAVSAYKASQEQQSKSDLVEQIIATNANYSEDDKDELLSSPEKVLNGLLPAKRAKGLREGNLNNNSDNTLSAELPE